MTKQNPENLPALPLTGMGFQLTQAIQSEVDVPDEIMDELTQEDYEGYDASAVALPIVTIRQKPASDEGGKTTQEPGGFRLRDATLEAPDVPGEQGLLVSFLLDTVTQTYWEEGKKDRPACKSNDGGRTGVGAPGGACPQCPLGQFGADGKRPKCNQGRSLLCYDHNLKAIYVLHIGPSGIKHYLAYLAAIKRMRVGAGVKQPMTPLLARTSVTLRYEAEPLPHYVPVFGYYDRMTKVDDLRSFRIFRDELRIKFATATDVATDLREEDHLAVDEDGQQQPPLDPSMNVGPPPVGPPVIDEFAGGLTAEQRTDMYEKIMECLELMYPADTTKQQGFLYWAANEGGLTSSIDLSMCPDGQVTDLWIDVSKRAKDAGLMQVR